MPQIEAGGEVIHYVKAGTGARTIVLVHGFGSDAGSWTRILPPLGAAATVYALVLPGHGLTPARAFGGLDWIAGVVAAAVGELSPDPVHLVGHSAGGGIALRSAELFPARWRALTLVGPAGLSEGRNFEFIPAMLGMTDPATAADALRLLVEDATLIDPPLVESVLAAHDRPHSLEAWQKMRPIAGEAWARREAARAALATLPMPVQIIWGEEDAILPPRGLEGLPPRVRLHVLPGLGHAPHMEAPAAVAALIAALDAEG